MKKARCVCIALLLLAMTSLAALAVEPLKLYPTGVGDGYAGRSWYGWNGSWAETSESSVRFWHNSDNRESGRGMIIINISLLAGRTLASGSATFNFYSYGINGTSLQWYGGDPGSEVVAGFSQAGGEEIAPLGSVGEGWLSYDVTSRVQSAINAGWSNVGFIFNAQNYCGGSVGSVEGDKAAYVQVTPEPSGLLALASGMSALAGFALRRRRG